jgi:hypothetical protein
MSLIARGPRVAPGDTRSCPAQGCDQRIPRNRAFCPAHWRKLPNELRVRIWEAYGEMPGGKAHMDALAEAIRYFRRRD